MYLSMYVSENFIILEFNRQFITYKMLILKLLTIVLTFVHIGNAGIPRLVPVKELRQARFIPVEPLDNNVTPTLPNWYNPKLALSGQQYYRENFLGFSLSQLYSVFLQITSSDFRRVILSTGNSTSSIKSAKKLYVGSFLFFMYQTIAKLPISSTENDISTSGYDFIKLHHTIRKIHEKAGKQAVQYKTFLSKPILQEEDCNGGKINERIWTAFKLDIQNSTLLQKYQTIPSFPPRDGGTEVYFNQFALAIGFWSMLGLPVLKPKAVLVNPNSTEHELLGYLHYFALVANSLGLEDQYNIFLQPGVKEAKHYYKSMMDEYLLPGLFHLDYETMVYIEMAVKGLHEILPLAELGTILHRFAQSILEIPTPHLSQVLSSQEKLYSSLLSFKDSVGRIKYVRNLGNNIALRLMNYSSKKDFNINIFDIHNFTIGLEAYGKEVAENLQFNLIQQNKSTKNLACFKTPVRISGKTIDLDHAFDRYDTSINLQ